VRILALILAVLTVARLSRLVAEDMITVGLRQWVVKRFGATSSVARLVHCAPWCLSIWFAFVLMPLAVLWPTIWLVSVLSVPAGSMAAAMILSLVERE
jgi:hypothetical protein